jgi:hypothetical protein
MARTPRGSWAGHRSFGFQEFFPEVSKENLTEESRTRMAAAMVEEINSVLLDLGLTRYRVDSLVLDSLQKDMQQSDQARWAGSTIESQGVTLMLRETGADRATGYAL